MGRRILSSILCAVALAVALTIAVGQVGATPQRPSVIKQVPVPGTLLLTFDDGPDHRTTPLLLDVLDRYGVRAVFFVNGHRFHRRTAGGLHNMEALREIARRGHWIGNHTFAHKDITALGDGWWHEVAQVNLQVSDITDRPVRAFRPPFGRIADDQIARLHAAGMTVVLWDVDSLDWTAHDGPTLFQRVRKLLLAKPEGGILLFHDTNRVTVEAMPLILEWIAQHNRRARAEGGGGWRWIGLDDLPGIQQHQ